MEGRQWRGMNNMCIGKVEYQLEGWGGKAVEGHE